MYNLNVDVDKAFDLVTLVPYGRYCFPVHSYSATADILFGPDSGQVEAVRQWHKDVLRSETTKNDLNRSAVSFYDLIELAVVRRFRECSASVTEIADFRSALSVVTPFRHVLASKLYLFDSHLGALAWHKVLDTRGIGNVIEPHKDGHRFCSLIRSLSDELSWDNTGTPREWTLTPWITVDPNRQFGKPAVTGARVTVETLLNSDTNDVEQLADEYLLSVNQVQGVLDSWQNRPLLNERKT